MGRGQKKNSHGFFFIFSAVDMNLSWYFRGLRVQSWRKKMRNTASRPHCSGDIPPRSIAVALRGILIGCACPRCVSPYCRATDRLSE